MIIALVSDTHGFVDLMRTGITAVLKHNPQAIVHLGDVGSLQCVEILGSCGIKAYMVCGNIDRNPGDLLQAATTHGVICAVDTIRVPIAPNVFLAAVHGHNAALVRQLIASGEFPYVVHGHTHKLRDERIGKTRVISPGAIFDPRGVSFPSMAVLNTDTDQLNLIPVG